MKKIFNYFSLALVCSVLFVALPTWAKDGDYKMESKLSQVSFATIKKQYVVEPATFSSLTGSLSKSGELAVAIDVKSVDTAVDIRNQRLLDLFFKVASNPTINISAQVDMKQVKKRGPVKKITTEVSVSFFGKSAQYQAELLVVKGTAERLIFTTTKPIIVSMSDFGIPQKNLANLANTVGDIPISGTVPVHASLVFKQ